VLLKHILSWLEIMPITLIRRNYIIFSVLAYTSIPACFVLLKHILSWLEIVPITLTRKN